MEIGNAKWHGTSRPRYKHYFLVSAKLILLHPLCTCMYRFLYVKSCVKIEYKIRICSRNLLHRLMYVFLKTIYSSNV